MSETVTKVAKAMAESAGFCWDNCAQSQWERDARAGIEALRDLTPEMRAAAAYYLGRSTDVGVLFSAMIDAALAPSATRETPTSEIPSQDRGTV